MRRKRESENRIRQWLWMTGVRVGCAVIAVVTVVAGVSSEIHAAPVTFRFEGLIASAFPMDRGTGVPFAVSSGDSIVTTLTFEPDSVGPVYPQSHSMRFELGGTVLEVQEFEITIANNEQRSIDLSGRIADPNNTPDVDFNEIGDNIIASCRGDGSLFCGVVPEHTNFVFRPLIVLSHQDSLLSSNDLLADPNVWNAFSLREMSLLFRNVDTGEDIYYVGAYVGQFSHVPEPSTMYLFVGFVFALAAYLARLKITKTAYPVLPTHSHSHSGSQAGTA